MPFLGTEGDVAVLDRIALIYLVFPYIEGGSSRFTKLVHMTLHYMNGVQVHETMGLTMFYPRVSFTYSFMTQ